MPASYKSPYDAAIVLANLMDKQGNLNTETRARVDLAAEIYKRGDVEVLVMCGWAYRDDSEIRIADAMRRYAIGQHGISEAALLTEPESRDTVGDAVYTKRNFAVPRGWSRVLVVTSLYHAGRSETIFSFVYGPAFRVEVKGADSPDADARQQSEAQSMLAFHNTFAGVGSADDSAIFERLRTAHPFYNGSVHPPV